MLFRRPLDKALCLLLCLMLLPDDGSTQPGTREMMADAMARMMEAMGLFDSVPRDPLSYGGLLGDVDWNTLPGSPWGGVADGPSRFSAMRDLMQRFGGRMLEPGKRGADWPPGWKPSRLEGVWEGRDGELLIVQGNRFRIYSREMQRVDGLIQVRGERLALYNPLDEHAQPFEFAESQGRLVMRDFAGQIYLYRRLLLDGGGGRTTPR
jgi:hypothetical protein